MVGKMIYAYGVDKHRPCEYGYMGTITGVENEQVFVHSKDNPIGYQDYVLNLDNVNKWLDQKLYVLR